MSNSLYVLFNPVNGCYLKKVPSQLLGAVGAWEPLDGPNELWTNFLEQAQTRRDRFISRGMPVEIKRVTLTVED